MLCPLPSGDFSLHPLWRLTNVLFKVRSGGLEMSEMNHPPGMCMKTLGSMVRKLKNATCSGDVHENKMDIDKMSGEKHGFCTKMPQLNRV